jgi:prepilin-type N-terminal cleavage/methylation domain-containing protein
MMCAAGGGDRAARVLLVGSSERSGSLAAKGHLGMATPREREAGFTLVELMVVVLIIGILVTIAFPVFNKASANAEATSCQANQRTITGAIDLAQSDAENLSSATDGQFASGGSGWYALLVPGWVKSKPTCPSDSANYYITAAGAITGDNGPTQTFKSGHQES